MIALDQLVKRIQQVPPLPDVVLRVLELSEDPECSVKDLVEVVQLDQGITLRVLRLCNSAYFGIPREISTLREALVFLGNNTLVNFILTSYAADFFRGASRGYGLDEGQIWKHAVATAVGADIIGKRVIQGDRGLLFTGALLHDVGKVILSEHVESELGRIAMMVEEENCPFTEAEKAILGYTHAEVGAQLAAAWNLPPVLVNSILYHHEPSRAREHQDEVSAVHVANAVSLSMGYGLGKDGLQVPLDQGALQRFDLETDDLIAIAAQVHAALNTAVDLIKIRN